MHDRFANGRAFRLLCALDEYTRESLAIGLARSIKSQDVILVLSRLMRLYGKPPLIRSYQQTEFTAGAVMHCMHDRRVGLAFIPSGRPRHNGFVESFNGKLGDECLNREWSRDLREARMLIKQWRDFYNHRRPHSSLRNRSPVQARQDVLRMESRLTV